MGTLQEATWLWEPMPGRTFEANNTQRMEFGRPGVDYGSKVV